MSFRVVGFAKVPGTEPQEFVLSLEDMNNAKRGYICTTETATEPVIREMLSNGGMVQNEIDVLFTRSST